MRRDQHTAEVSNPDKYCIATARVIREGRRKRISIISGTPYFTSGDIRRPTAKQEVSATLYGPNYTPCSGRYSVNNGE